MKRIFKWIFIFGISLTICLFLPAVVDAQSQAQDDALPDPCLDPLDGDCPIDSGLLVLIAIGAGYGIKKVVDSRKTQGIE